MHKGYKDSQKAETVGKCTLSHGSHDCSTEILQHNDVTMGKDWRLYSGNVYDVILPVGQVSATC